MTPSDNALGTELDRAQRMGLIAGIAGVIGCAIGLVVDRDQFLRSYLWAYLYWLGMSIGCLGVLLMSGVVGGRWGVVIRKFLQAGARTLPLMAVLSVPVLAGIGSLYIWSWPEVRARDANIQAKASYLNVPFFIGRLVVYFVIWMALRWMLQARADRVEASGDPDDMVRQRQLAAPGLLLFVLISTFAFIDLIMSLEPHWFSTIYGAMFLVGQVLTALAFAIVVLVALWKRGYFREILTVQHFHDLGNMMFAFTILWAYLSFSQFLIIWAGNLPEEIPWYVRRFSGGWGVIAVVLALFHFAVPFALLLFRFVKRNPELLEKVALWMLFIRMLDVFWVVEPAFYQDGMPLHRQVFQVSWMDFVAPVAVGGLWIAGYVWFLKRAPLMPEGDPRLHEVPKRMVEGLH